MNDKEIAKRVINMISNLKKSKTVFRVIIEKTKLPIIEKSEKFTVVKAHELERLREIEKRFYDIGDIARNTYHYLRGEKSGN